jgi:hypothetical protein
MLAVLVGYLGTAYQLQTAIGICSAAAIFLVIKYPELALVAVIVTEGLSLPITLLGLNLSVLNWAVYLLLVLAAFIALTRAGRQLRFIGLVAITAVAIMVIFGYIGSAGHIPVEQELSGGRLISTPALAYIVGISGSVRRSTRFIMIVSVAVSGLSLVAGVVEQAAGVQNLLVLGLEYGTSVRTIGDEVRAPGLFMTNYSMGAFAGVVGSLVLCWKTSARSGTQRNAIRWVSLAIAVGALIVSTYRNGMLVLLLSVLLWTVVPQSRRRGVRIVGALAGSVLLAVYVIYSGLASTESLAARFTVWHDLIAGSSALFGSGIGYSGAASVSRFSSSAIIVDNYYVSLWLQFGIIAAVVLAGLFKGALQLVRRSRFNPTLAPAYVFAAVLIACFFSDFWEYTSAASLALFAVGASMRWHLDTADHKALVHEGSLGAARTYDYTISSR